jgi:cytochrome o ubiquinol oxidase subunit 2
MRRALPCALLLLPLLAACGTVVLSPSGDIAGQQRDLLLGSTLLMLLIVVPVMLLTVFFAWRYSDKRRSRYDPEWSHSTGLELVIWTAPLMIIICIGAITWTGTHLLDPFRPLDRLGERRPVPENTLPLEVQVVALDWKWLFIYPDEGIATVNDVAVPVDRPVRFHLTSQSVMNAFYVPALAGMIYAMPGMESQLNAVMNVPGNYEGFSSNYSGRGFSGMRFRLHGLSQPDFDVWIAKARIDGEPVLDRARYLELAKPSENVAPSSYGDVEPELFRRILNRCVEEGRLCIDQMVALDAQGGTGPAGTVNTIPAGGRRASALGHAPFYVAEFCTPAESVAQYGADTARLLAPPPGPGGAAAPDETL